VTPPRWSAGRVAVAVLVVLGLAGGGAVEVRQHLREAPALAATWYAPYVDVTLTPHHAFEDPEVNGADDVVLGFVVADPGDRCAPSWGAAYDLDAAATALDLDRRIARYRERGGDVIVSFGGAANDELAVACADDDELVDAYRAVVDRYDVTTIDLDVEGEALADTASITRRAQALATVQSTARRAGRDLSVWLTLPVAPSGLTSSGVFAVEAMLAAEVDLGGVNVMTMSYGASRPSGTTMAAAVEASIEATRDQLDAAYRAADLPLDAAVLWGKIGVTPMIGVNDAVTDTFTLADARTLRDLARDRGLGRVSIWSANRDAPCRPRAVTAEVSDHCSGVAQSSPAFSRTLDVMPGRPRDGAGHRTRAATAVTAVTVPSVPDDPATSPYPVWEREATYVEGTKVVLHGRVFAALWWTTGDEPRTGAADGAPSPWRLVGPVLPDDRRPATTTVPAGTFPEWDPATEYRAGARVVVAGVAYRARWWTRGDDPTGPGDGTQPNPWTPVAPS